MSRHHGIPSQPHGDQHLKDVDPAWVVRASIGRGKSIHHNIMITRSNKLIALPLNRGVHSGKPWMAAVLAVATLCVSAVQAQVVFGNLGPNGDGPLSNVNVDTDTLPLAAGFMAGASDTLGSVTLGRYNLNGGNATPTTVSIHSDASGVPGTAIQTSAAVNVGNKGLYTFSLSGVNLTGGDVYYIVLNNGASWYYAGSGTTFTTATGQKGSGYVDQGHYMHDGLGWISMGTGDFSLSITVVPEPHEYAMMAGAGMVGFAVWRRRAQRAAKA